MWREKHVTTITFLRTDDWVRVIALVSMIQSGAFILIGGAVIIGRLFGYDVFFIGSGILYLVTGMTVGIIGLFLGMCLYDGVEEKNPTKLLAWIVYAVLVQLLLLYDLYNHVAYYPSSENWENILGIVLCLIIYTVFISFVNIHRLQLTALVESQRQDQAKTHHHRRHHHHHCHFRNLVSRSLSRCRRKSPSPDQSQSQSGSRSGADSGSEEHSRQDRDQDRETEEFELESASV